MRYFYTDHSQNVVGPVSSQEIQDLVNKGALSDVTQVCEEGSENWTALPAHFRRLVKRSSPTMAPEPAQPASPGKAPLILALIAIMLSLLAILLPFLKPHKSLKDFDFSTPANALRSLQTITQLNESKLSVELATMLLSEDKDKGLYSLLYDDPKLCDVVRTIETKASGEAANNGLLVSFIKRKRPDSVEEFFVQSFEKNRRGQLVPALYPHYVETEKKTEEDKRLESMTERWKKEGRLD